MARWLLSVVFLAVIASTAAAQRPPSWNDSLVDHFAGAWNLEGTVKGQPTHHTVKVEWMLNHQFLQIHEQTAPDAPASESRYDSLWFLGYDSVTHKYVLHLMDVFGGRFSETLGIGTRDGNDIRFVFQYPDGPFHTRWRWIPGTHTWEWHMEQKEKGEWKPFADFKLTPRDRAAASE